MHILTYCILMAVFPGVLIIVASLLWLRGVFNQGSVGRKQTILCLCNSYRSHKHKHKINNGAESRLRSRVLIFIFFLFCLKTSSIIIVVQKICGPLLCSQDDPSPGTLQFNHRNIPGTSAEAKWKPPGLSEAAMLHLGFDSEQLPRQDHYSEHNQTDVSEIPPQGWICL